MEFDDLLDDGMSSVNPYDNLEMASKGKRFANMIVDTICFYILVFIVGAFWYTVVDPNFTEEGTPLDYVLSLSCFVGYFMLTEYLMKGKSIGKFITGTRAVRMDGTAITAKDVLLRSLSRLVPFEAFSYLGSSMRGWHDKWTDTKVIDERSRKSDNDVY